MQLTRERLRLLHGIADCVYYVAESDNEATLAMHRNLGFVLVGEVSIQDPVFATMGNVRRARTAAMCANPGR